MYSGEANGACTTVIQNIKRTLNVGIKFYFSVGIKFYFSVIFHIILYFPTLSGFFENYHLALFHNIQK